MKLNYDFSRVTEAVDARIKKGILPGATLCVHKEGRKIFEYTEGYCDIEAKDPLFGNALFRLASMTKPITAAAVMIQHDSGKLNVTDKVSKYFPSFTKHKIGRLADGKIEFAGYAERDMTIEDLLTHGSGLGSGEVGDAQYAACPRKAGETLSDAAKKYSEWYLDFSPGSSQMYSPIVALDVAAAIVEKTSDTEYEEFLRKNIFDPLEMNSTGYRLNGDMCDRVVTMYKLSDDGCGMTRINMGREGHIGFPENIISGCTGLFGTLNDYSNFAQMLCGYGEYSGRRVLSEESVKRISKPHYPVGFAGMDEYSDWGYTVRVRQKTTPEVQELTAGSYGWSGAFSTHFWVDPVRKITGVFMCNLDNAGGAGAITAFEFECNVMRSLLENKQ